MTRQQASSRFAMIAMLSNSITNAQICPTVDDTSGFTTPNPDSVINCRDELSLTPMPWKNKLYDQLDSFLRLRRGWDSYDAPAPNCVALQNARNILDKLWRIDFSPEHILPSCEGGVGVTFRKQNRFAIIECDNDGDVILSMDTDEPTSDATVQVVDSTDDEMLSYLDQLRQFIDFGTRASAT